jgi:excinuclease UvrABC nuclease subunit
MPGLPNDPGLYLWDVDGTVTYVGQTRIALSKRLGSNGYATIRRTTHWLDNLARPMADSRQTAESMR